MGSRVIRVDWIVYERLAELSMALGTYTPGSTLSAFMKLPATDRHKLVTALWGQSKALTKTETLISLAETAKEMQA